MRELCYTILLPMPVSTQRPGAIMVKRQVMFTFPQEQLKEPIIFNLSRQFQRDIVVVADARIIIRNINYKD